MDINAASLPNVLPLKCATSVDLRCDKTAHFRVTGPEQHAGALIMLFNQQLDVPQLSGGWIILAKGERSLTQTSANCAHNLRELNCFILCIKTKS